KNLRLINTAMSLYALGMLSSCVPDELDVFETEQATTDLADTPNTIDDSLIALTELKIPENFVFSTSRDVRISIIDGGSNAHYDVYSYDSEKFANIALEDDVNGSPIVPLAYEEGLLVSRNATNGSLSFVATIPDYVQQLYVRKKTGFEYKVAIIDIVGDSAHYDTAKSNKQKNMVSFSARISNGNNNNDNDGDGILNVDDLDNDNDGILDSDEGCDNSSLASSEFNGTFGTLSGDTNRDLQNPPSNYTFGSGFKDLLSEGRYAVVNQTSAFSARGFASDYNYAGHTDGSATDAFLIVNGAPRQGVFYSEEIVLTGNEEHIISFYSASMKNTSVQEGYELEARVTDLSSSTVYTSAVTGVLTSGTWEKTSLVFTLPTTGTYLFELQNLSTQAGGNDFAIDDISIARSICAGIDSDNDGIKDHFDLDSDNDGCPDALEGAANFVVSDLEANNRLASSVGANGVPTVASVSGQGVGTAQDADQQDIECAIEDVDGDGISDDEDDFPNDAQRAFQQSTPSANGWGTLVFEDLWPYIGDYDFNDTALKYRFTSIMNAEGNVVQIDILFEVTSDGAGLTNAVGVELSGILPAQISSVTGSLLTRNVFNIAANGLEANQNNAVVILFDDNDSALGNQTTVSVAFDAPVSPSTLGSAPFNPFLVVGDDRAHEIHLPNQSRTTLGEIVSDEGSMSRDSDGNYLSPTGLPWAINIIGEFPVAKEKVPVNQAYVHFNDWVISGGAISTDWYVDSPGYRNIENLKQ
ncbi:MAG: LruC domain-containing protein, partial [Bacteroidota bacterium]